jgi:hypothetical protein
MTAGICNQHSALAALSSKVGVITVQITSLVYTNVLFSANAPVGDQNVSATTRMEMAVERGEALSVVLLLSFI